jgi:chromosome segregation ATPase
MVVHHRLNRRNDAVERKRVHAEAENVEATATDTMVKTALAMIEEERKAREADRTMLRSELEQERSMRSSCLEKLEEVDGQNKLLAEGLRAANRRIDELEAMLMRAGMPVRKVART